MVSVSAAVFSEAAAPVGSDGATKPADGTLFGALFQQVQAEMDLPMQVPAATPVAPDASGDVPVDLPANVLVFGTRITVVSPEPPDAPPPASAALLADIGEEEDAGVTATVGTVGSLTVMPQPLPLILAETDVSFGEVAIAPSGAQPESVSGPPVATPTAGEVPLPLPAVPESEVGVATPAERGSAQAPAMAPVPGEAPRGIPPVLKALVDGSKPGATDGPLGPADPADAGSAAPSRLPAVDIGQGSIRPQPVDVESPGMMPAEPLVRAVAETKGSAGGGNSGLGEQQGPAALPWASTSPSDAGSVVEMPAVLPAEPADHVRLAGQVRALVLNGESEARLYLEPADLGQVVVRLQMVDGKLAVDLSAVRPEARAALELALPNLQTALEQQGLRVQGISVSSETSNWNSGAAGQGEPWQQQGQPRQPWQPQSGRPDPYAAAQPESVMAGAGAQMSHSGIDYLV